MKKLMGFNAPPIKYDSVSTRYVSLDVFTGGANIISPLPGPERLPQDGPEDLMLKFNSQACKFDLPSQRGIAPVKRSMLGKAFDAMKEYNDWIRIGGLPPKDRK